MLDEQKRSAANVAGIVICLLFTDDDVELRVLGCRLTYQGQIVTNAEARFNVALYVHRNRKAH